MIPPQVDVLLAVHNGGSYLTEAVESILGQTLADFTLIVVDDGSTDETARYLASLRDARLRVLRNEPGQGQTRALNRALEASRSPYVARMDADDIAEPERLEKQLAYLKAHPEVSVLGTAVTIIDEDGAPTGAWQTPAAPACLGWQTTWRCPLCHPSVMVRADFIRGLGGYDSRFEVAQDYDLWARVVAAGGKLAVLPERLLRYRMSASQMTARRRPVMDREVLEIAFRQTRWALQEPELPLEAVREMLRVYHGEPEPSPAAVQRGLALARRVTEACVERAAPQERAALRDFAADAIVFGAEAALRRLAPAQARAGLLAALRGRPGRTLRPHTLRRLLATHRAPSAPETDAA
jgi:GT2 family glycosyltransferase